MNFDWKDMMRRVQPWLLAPLLSWSLLNQGLRGKILEWFLILKDLLVKYFRMCELAA